MAQDKTLEERLESELYAIGLSGMSTGSLAAKLVPFIRDEINEVRIRKDREISFLEDFIKGQAKNSLKMLEKLGE